MCMYVYGERIEERSWKMLNQGKGEGIWHIKMLDEG